MTDEVQPLTWQKRTNIEEHQQFFAKINEIVANLAPTVEAAEAALEDAGTALTNANNAVLTANAASTAAQQASGTVAGYNSRLTTVENSYIKKQSATPQTIDGDVQITNGHDLDVGGDFSAMGDVVLGDQMEVAGMSVERNGNKTVLSNDNGLQIGSEMTVQNTSTGVRNMEAVNGTRLQNDLDAYAPMVRTTGSQNIAGIKNFIDKCSFLTPPKQTFASFTARLTTVDRFSEFCRIPLATSTVYVIKGICAERTNDTMAAFFVRITTDGGVISAMESVTNTIIARNMSVTDKYVDMGARVEDGYIVLSIGLNTVTNNAVSVMIIDCFYSSGFQPNVEWLPTTPGSKFTHRTVIG